MIGFVDLSSQTCHTDSVDVESRKLFLGGRGINASLLYRHLQPNTLPLSPQAPLIIGTGLLTGLPCPSASRSSITGKSPETGLLADSNIGGHFGSAMRKTGFDHLVIRGESPEPVLVVVRDGEISLESADFVWGRDVPETTRLLKERYGEKSESLCIGQAGENLVRFACVRHGPKSAAGRGGLGCLMGSKRLKAVVAAGSHSPSIFSRKELLRFTAKINKRLLQSRTVQTLKKYGTPFLFDLHNHKGIVRTRNGQLNLFKEGKAVRAAVLKDLYQSQSRCFGCVIGCRHTYRASDPQGNVISGEGLEYGTMAAFGPICAIDDPHALLRLNNLVNSCGLDSITTGNIIAWAMELEQRGLLADTVKRGQALRWGDAESVIELVHRIVNRQGLGDFLANGPREMLPCLPAQAEQYLIWVKNLIQSDSVDVRAYKGFALSVATATRGADHLRSRPTLEALALSESELERVYGAPVSTDPTSYEGKARMVWWTEREFALADALGVCRFAQRFNSPEHISVEELREFVYYATGLEFTESEFSLCGERITTLERMFLAREGVTRADDTLPPRYFEPMPLGRYKGEKVVPERFDAMLDEYYSLHGWDAATGTPLHDTLETLGLRTYL